MASSPEVREPPPPGQLRLGLSLAALALSGTSHNLLAKTLYELPARGPLRPHDRLFRKPYFITFVMMLALSLSGVIQRWHNRHKRPKNEQGLEQPLLPLDPLEMADPPPRSTWRALGAAALPSALDLTSTILSNIGLLFVTASVHQMLRSAILIFSVAIAIPCYGAQLRFGHFVGVFFCLVGVMVVGFSNILGTEVYEDVDGDSDWEYVPEHHTAFGMFLVILAQAFQAAGIHLEQYLIMQRGITAEQLVGVESCMGTVLMACLVLPACYVLPGTDLDSRQENTVDTLRMVAKYPLLPCLLAADLVSLCIFSWSGTQILPRLSGTTLSLLELARTLLVWVGDVALYYLTPTEPGVGEPLDDWSWLQAVGLLFIAVASVAYSVTSSGTLEEERRIDSIESFGQEGSSVQGQSPMEAGPSHQAMMHQHMSRSEQGGSSSSSVPTTTGGVNSIPRTVSSEMCISASSRMRPGRSPNLNEPPHTGSLPGLMSPGAMASLGSPSFRIARTPQA